MTLKLYADDAVAEKRQQLCIRYGHDWCDDLYDTAKVALLDYIEGATVDPVTGAKELSVGTASPRLCGLWPLRKVIRSKVSYWRAIWIKR